MSTLVLASGEASSSMDILLPPLYEVFWSAIVFLVIWIVLGLFLPKIFKTLDDRQNEIAAGLNASEAAKEEAALGARERRDLLRKANEEARETRERAEQDAQRIIAEAREKAIAEAARVTTNAERQIATERHTAELSLRRDVGTLATELAERIIGEQLKDTALSARVIDRFMDDLEADLTRHSEANTQTTEVTH